MAPSSRGGEALPCLSHAVLQSGADYSFLVSQNTKLLSALEDLRHRYSSLAEENSLLVSGGCSPARRWVGSRHTNSVGCGILRGEGALVGASCRWPPDPRNAGTWDQLGRARGKEKGAWVLCVPWVPLHCTCCWLEQDPFLVTCCCPPSHLCPALFACWQPQEAFPQLPARAGREQRSRELTAGRGKSLLFPL